MDPKVGVNTIGKLISEGFGLSISKSDEILKILSVWGKSFSLIFFSDVLDHSASFSKKCPKVFWTNYHVTCLIWMNLIYIW